MGRPTSLTPEVQEAICKALRAGNYLEQAASAGGIHRDTLRSWMQRGATGEEPFAEFLGAVKEAEDKGERLLLRQVRAGVDNWQSRAWVLERRWPKRWAARVRQAVTEELDAFTDRLQRRLDDATYRKVLDASREDAPGEGAGSQQH